MGLVFGTLEFHLSGHREGVVLYTVYFFHLLKFAVLAWFLSLSLKATEFSEDDVTRLLQLDQVALTLYGQAYRQCGEQCIAKLGSRLAEFVTSQQNRDSVTKGMPTDLGSLENILKGAEWWLSIPGKSADMKLQVQTFNQDIGLLWREVADCTLQSLRSDSSSEFKFLYRIREEDKVVSKTAWLSRSCLADYWTMHSLMAEQIEPYELTPREKRGLALRRVSKSRFKYRTEQDLSELMVKLDGLWTMCVRE